MLRKGIAIVIGCLLVGTGVNLFILPHKLMDGGIIGIGLLAKYYFSWPPGLVMILVSLPIYMLVFVYDRRLFYNSFHGMLLSSFFIDWLSPLRRMHEFPIPFSAVAGGVFIGAGIGIMLAFQTNTGGTDLLAQFLATRLNIPVALLIFLIDGFIILGSIEVIGRLNTIFSLITILSVAVATHFFLVAGQPRKPYVVIGSVTHFMNHK
ncbi:YitT family protein [Brevibacillus humidisoli]|uniref:YitT family protein n=1 Tax=Brevibacillus humidisoli TaxID=2895522 RepID=UPI001E351C02|nr:YitT family protein [Brevibacillus humidisoli]UFJ41468.1 YitT family protein [Brevibacillus humidisoli]